MGQKALCLAAEKISSIECHVEIVFMIIIISIRLCSRDVITFSTDPLNLKSHAWTIQQRRVQG